MNEKFEKLQNIKLLSQCDKKQVLSSNLLIRPTWETNKHRNQEGIRTNKMRLCPAKLAE